ncbi:MAG: hypothetical protein IPJ32_18110 [Sphingobacteriaceae bacterium]|nr:hypothetical protein [Sphingobacteriaceae bacterium]
MGILRFLLALSVIASHASGIGIPLPDGKPYPAWIMSLIDGRQSVALFLLFQILYGYGIEYEIPNKHFTLLW